MNFKGGRYIHNGYWLVLKPDHRYHDRHGYVREHRFVYEEYYNCSLLPWSDVHHKNGIKIDNRIENLEAMLKSKHTSSHMKGKKHSLIDMSNRYCLVCNSKETYIKKNGRPWWFNYRDGYACRKCHRKIKKSGLG